MRSTTAPGAARAPFSAGTGTANVRKRRASPRPGTGRCGTCRCARRWRPRRRRPGSARARRCELATVRPFRSTTEMPAYSYALATWSRWAITLCCTSGPPPDSSARTRREGREHLGVGPAPVQPARHQPGAIVGHGRDPRLPVLEDDAPLVLDVVPHEAGDERGAEHEDEDVRPGDAVDPPLPLGRLVRRVAHRPGGHVRRALITATSSSRRGRRGRLFCARGSRAVQVWSSAPTSASRPGAPARLARRGRA